MDSKKGAEELTLMNRILYASAIEDEEFALNMMAIILGEDCTLKESPQAEKELRNVFQKKYVRLDAFLKMYLEKFARCEVFLETEVQNQKDEHLPKRIRHYVALIDANMMKSGESDYSKMQNVCVIVIASYDIGGKGRYRHRIASRSDDDDPVELNDGIEKIILYTKGNDPENISEELMWMLYYFEHTTEEVAQRSGSRRLMKMSERVEAIRKDPEFNLQAYIAREEKERMKKIIAEESRTRGLEEGRVEGRNAGLLEAHKSDALGMKAEGIALDIIHKITGLSREVIEAL